MPAEDPGVFPGPDDEEWGDATEVGTGEQLPERGMRTFAAQYRPVVRAVAYRVLIWALFLARRLQP